MKKQFLICDDHSAIRKGVRLMLTAEFSGAEFDEAENSVEVLKKLKLKKWDVLILDVDMPGRSGLEVLKQMKDEESKVPVLVFSMHPEEQIAIRALKLGAAGYLAKDSADSELLIAVQTLLSGKKYITSSLTQSLILQLDNPEGKESHELLSDREYETFLLIAKGQSVSQIAGTLSLSAQTVSTYRTRILEKTGMKTNAELTAYALRNKLA